MEGALTVFPGMGVRPAFLNLSKLRPLKVPHAITACRMSIGGMFTVNSPDSSIRVWLWRWGERLIAIKAGLALVGIAQATVVTLGLPAFPTHETSTACMG